MTTFGDRVYELGGSPVGAGSNGGAPCVGKIWWVDGTNGLNSNSGRKPKQAKKTIQAAVDSQISETSSLGDIIYVMPGVYPESITGNLTKVSIIGIPQYGHAAGTIAINPTAGSAYTGDMYHATLKNLLILSPSTSNKTVDAVYLTNMRWSSIENCTFAGADGTCVTGLQVGSEADTAVAGACDYNLIANNIFSTHAGYNSEFTHPIKIGSAGSTGAGAKTMVNTRITGNIVYGTTIGIYIGVVAGAQYGSIIDHNFVSSGSREHGCATAGISNISASATTLVVENWINAEDGLVNWNTACTMNNTVANAGTVVKELPTSGS